MKKFLITLLFIAITLISFSQSTQVSLDTNTILIGEQIKLKIICEKIASPINFPSFYDTIVEGVEIISRSSIDTILESNNNEKETLSLSQEYIITAWDSGAYYIPSFRLNEQIKTNPLLLNVLSVTIDPNADLKDIKQPLDPEYNLSDSLPWIITLLLIILIRHTAIGLLFSMPTKLKTLGLPFFVKPKSFAKFLISIIGSFKFLLFFISSYTVKKVSSALDSE